MKNLKFELTSAFIGSVVDGLRGEDWQYYNLPWPDVRTHEYKRMPWGASIQARFSQMEKHCPKKYWTMETLTNWVKSTKEQLGITAKKIVIEHAKECETCKRWIEGVPLQESLKDL